GEVEVILHLLALQRAPVGLPPVLGLEAGVGRLAVHVEPLPYHATTAEVRPQLVAGPTIERVPTQAPLGANQHHLPSYLVKGGYGFQGLPVVAGEEVDELLLELITWDHVVAVGRVVVRFLLDVHEDGFLIMDGEEVGALTLDLRERDPLVIVV